MKKTLGPHQEKLEVVVADKEVSEITYTVGRAAKLTLLLLLTSQAPEANVSVQLVEPEARAEILGLVVGRGSQVLKLHSLQLHQAPQTVSNLLVKSVLADQAIFIYKGAIRVERSAQRTDAYQRNENLLVSEAAHAESQPTLEILANDVRCTHGATIGSLSPDQLWYLASRGLSPPVAKRLIVEGFLLSAFSRISDTIGKYRALRQLKRLISQEVLHG